MNPSQAFRRDTENRLLFSIFLLCLRRLFCLAWSWVGYPSRRPKGCGMQSPSGPKVYPKSHRDLGVRRREEEESNLINLKR